MDKADIETITYQHFTEMLDKQNSFIMKLMTFVGAVLVGYGYILLGLNLKGEEVKTNHEIGTNYDPYIILFFTVAILMVSLKIIFDNGYAFRRDQLVIYRILRKHKMILAKNENDDDKVFPYYYDPLKKFYMEGGKVKTLNKQILFFLPALHNTFALALNICILFVVGSFIIKLLPNIVLWPIILIFVCYCYLSILIVRNKNRRLKQLYLPYLQNIY